MNDKDRMIAIA